MNHKLYEGEDPEVFEGFPTDNVLTLSALSDAYMSIPDTDIERVKDLEFLEEIIKAFSSILNTRAKSIAEATSRQNLYTEAFDLYSKCLIKLLRAVEGEGERLTNLENGIQDTLALVVGNPGADYDIALAQAILDETQSKLGNQPKNLSDSIEMLLNQAKEAVLKGSLSDLRVCFGVS